MIFYRIQNILQTRFVSSSNGQYTNSLSNTDKTHTFRIVHEQTDKVQVRLPTKNQNPFQRK